jgi:hypothetical protein
MSQKILVANYSYNVSSKEFESMASELGPAFADVPGFLWKIWLIDSDKKEAGAVYTITVYKIAQSTRSFSPILSQKIIP